MPRRTVPDQDSSGVTETSLRKREQKKQRREGRGSEIGETLALVASMVMVEREEVRVDERAECRTGSARQSAPQCLG